METLSRILHGTHQSLPQGSRSDFLFAQPRLLFAIGSILNLSGHFAEYNQSRTPEEADARATRADWETVGNDLRSAMGRYKRDF